MRWTILLLLILTIFGCGQEPAGPRLLRDMADLDRSFVPAFIFTHMKREPESSLSLESLKDKWKRFYGKHYELKLKYGVDIVDNLWKEDFNHVSSILVSAESLVKSKKLIAANKKLSELPVVLRGVRKRHNLVYFLDELNDFYTTMHEIVLFVKSKKDFQERDKNRLKELTIAAIGKWQKARKTQVDPKTFGFDKKKISTIKNRMAEEQKILNAFSQQLLDGDFSALRESAKKIEPAFISLYRAFGDIEPIYLEAKKQKAKPKP